MMLALRRTTIRALQAFWQNSRDVETRWQDGSWRPAFEVLRAGFGRRTKAGSTGDAAGDTAVATTGVARTTAARCMAKDAFIHHAALVAKGRK
jgi:hypothetical protein